MDQETIAKILESKIYRPGLPPIPARMKRLPIERGYPVPWFVAKVDDHYDFRIQDGAKRWPAVRDRLCWLCGGPLGRYLAFTIGPMCAINRTSGEPPAHRECAEFSVKACPFLTQQEPERRAGGLPADAEYMDGGLRRQPGVILIWITHSFTRIPLGQGEFLIRMGDPVVELTWWREGRTATRAEILESIESGYPLLSEAAVAEGPAAIAELIRATDKAMDLVPAE